MSQYQLGRQPIFDADMKLFGYELLYRPSDEAANQSVFDGDSATSEVIINSFWELGLQKVVGDNHAFVNLTRGFLLNADLLPPANKQLVLEVLEDIEVDEEIVAAVTDLRKKGYTIALDDFIYHAALRPLIKLANIIKFDIRAQSRAHLETSVNKLRKFPLKMLAEKVETPEEFDWCKSLGFDYFQGYFLCRPRVIKGKRLPTNRANTMRMFAELERPDLDIDKLEEIISQDVTMTFKLLRYINSAAFSLTDEITSIRHAIIYLGMKEIKSWARLLALAGVDDKPEELIKTSLIRAKMCETLSQRAKHGQKETAFIVGLFSALDAIMDTPMEELLADLPLAHEVVEAILHQQGPYHEILHCTLAYERGDWDELDCNRLTSDEISDAYLLAIEWADHTVGGLER